jgi:molecular chaperone DnaK (HSP70)
MGSYNARVATFDDHSNHPVCAHNSDGRRTTRVVLPADDSGNGGFSSRNTVPVTAENLDKFINEKLLPLAHDAAHTKNLSVIASIPNDETIPEDWLGALRKSGRGVITEAAAACLAYDLENKMDSIINKRILVVDGGASALKVAILRGTSNGLLCLELTKKTDAVNGEALVETLGQSVAQQFEIKHRFPRGEVWQSKRARAKLQRACENGLTTLQINNTLTIHVESLYEGMDCQVTMSKAKWDHLSSKLVRSAKEFLNTMSTQEIDTVLLSGNMHSWLKPMVQSIFPGKLLSGVDPSEAIAIGCTMQANWNLTHSKEAMAANIPMTLDVPMSPISIAIVQKDNIVIEKGTPLPALVNYDLAEEEESSSVVIWQVKPTEKHLATLGDLSANCSVRMLLTESKKLRIAVGGESIVIG